MILKVHLTEDDKQNGSVDAYDCPVARASRRSLQAINGRLDCWVVFGRITIYRELLLGDQLHIRHRVPLPYAIDGWVSAYDLSAGQVGDPIEFEIEIPDEVFV